MRVVLSSNQRNRRVFVRTVLSAVLASSLAWSSPGKACAWTARPSVTLGLDSTTNQPGTELKALIEHWSVGCATDGCPLSDAYKFWDGVELHYSSEPDTKLEVNSLGPDQTRDNDGMGDFVVNAPVFGVKLFAVFRAGCGDTVSSSMLIEARSEPIVMAPNLPELNQITVFVDDPAFPRALPVVEPLQIPANYRFHIHSDIMADPRGAEVATVHVSGAGIDFTKNYPADPNVSAAEQFFNDPDADLLATRTEEIRFWVEFEGVSSPTRKLSVVPYDQDGDPILGDDGGGNDGTDAGNAGQASTDPGTETGGMTASAGDSATPSDGGATSASGGSAGTGTSPKSSGKSGGCAMVHDGSRSSALLMLLLAAAGSARVRARRAARSFTSRRR